MISREFLYENVRNRVLDMIDTGLLYPGEKVPSLRRMSEQLGVSISTVMKAYVELERTGHLETKPQSGHYVSGSAKAAVPSPPAFSTASEPMAVDLSGLYTSFMRAMTNPDILPFGAAVPSDELLPSRELSRLAKKIGDENPQLVHSYGYAEGEPALRQQIALRMLDAGVSVDPDDIIITCGATEAINLALRAVTRPGDTVVVESPCWFGYLLMIESMGLKALEIPTDAERGPNLEALAEAMARFDVKAAVLQPNFGNPLGGLYPEETRRELCKLLGRSGVAIIEDDIYGELSYEGKRPKSLMAHDRYGMVMHVNAYSKTLSPGSRVGWIIPGRLHRDILRLKISSTLVTARLPQLVIARFLAEGRDIRCLRKLRTAIRSQTATYSAHIARYFPEGTVISRPLGGYVLWVGLDPATDGQKLYKDALRNRIGIVPGMMYSSQERYTNFIRINCGHPWSGRIQEGLKTLGALAQEATG